MNALHTISFLPFYSVLLKLLREIDIEAEFHDHSPVLVKGLISSRSRS
jgi:hypothetical protein